MPLVTLEFRLRIRDRDNATDLLILSSRASDPNPLLIQEPNADGQRVDVFRGTQEIGVVEWLAADRDDGGDTRTITALIADSFARNQMLSNVCIGQFSRNSGAWTTFHTGFLNSLDLVDPLTFKFVVGDTDRREQDAELFKFLTTTFNRGSCLIGGPIRAPTPTEHGDPPQYSFAGVRDFGPVRMEKVAATAGTNTVAFEIVSGYVRPYYRRSLTAIGADEVETINRLARPWATPCGNRYGNTGRRAFMDFPGLIARLEPVAGGTIRNFRPVAAPTTSPNGDIDRLVNGSGMGLYVAWPIIITQPSNGDQYDVTVFPNEISEASPLHWAGHPVDLVTQAWTQEGISYNAAAAASVKSALANLWVEYRFKGVMELRKVVTEYVFGPFGIVAITNADGEQVLKTTRTTPPASVSTVTSTQIITDE